MMCARQLTDRECLLDIALLRCGKLREGLESFQEWLSDMESRQSKQKPFSIDNKALRPQQQIQEVCEDVQQRCCVVNKCSFSSQMRSSCKLGIRCIFLVIFLLLLYYFILF